MLVQADHDYKNEMKELWRVTMTDPNKLGCVSPHVPAEILTQPSK